MGNIKEHIICSAIYIKNYNKYEYQPDNIKTGFVICGRRHHNCFNLLTCLGIKKQDLEFEIIHQGFMTNLDRYVNRSEALEIAKKTNPSNILFSEDLY